MTTIGSWFAELFEGDPYSRTKQVDPRDLTTQDRLSWDAALDRQPRGAERRRADIIRLMRNRNPVRYRRLQKDFHWLQRQMKKAGLNPEDARFLL